jgi:N6-adenosine-specific RNA methylase IME4
VKDPRHRRYAVIYADPPWRYSSKHHGHGGAEDHYSTMALSDIKAICVPASEDCALFLWATMPLLPQAFEVIESWGFRYKTTAFCWVKQNPSGVGLVTGLGHWTRSNVEVCLLATRGRPRPRSSAGSNRTPPVWASSPGWATGRARTSRCACLRLEGARGLDLIECTP